MRGVAVNQLGDYYRVKPDRPPVFPLRRRDFARIHRLGFNVVRLVLSWSKLEPRRGKLNRRYLERIDAAVRFARRSGIYLILDMHQDAWGKEVATPPGAICPAGLTPSIGWDGAPRWATFFDGMSTCHNTFRELSPAVTRAFDNFYANRDGIQSHLVRVWAALARRYAPYPAIAGYDLLNEPHPGSLPEPAASEAIGAFYARAITAIRRAERKRRGGRRHIVFFEPDVIYDVTASPDRAPPPGFTTDRDIVFSPHLYPGTFSPLSADQEFMAAEAAAHRYRAPFWIGEWGWYSGDATDDYADIIDFAEHEDAALVGDAWWEWRQRCGDPHVFGNPGSAGAPIANGLVRYACPHDRPLGIPPTTRRVLSRSYVRAAPGRITKLISDPATGAFRVTGSDRSRRGSCKLAAWTPRGPGDPPRFEGRHLSRIRTRRVAGGWRTTACAHGSYELRRIGG
jgi:endoglycosylceramidase